jgi:hypothetical protein
MQDDLGWIENAIIAGGATSALSHVRDTGNG